MTVELPSPAEVLAQAYRLASTHQASEVSIQSARVLLGIARELREGSRMPVDQPGPELDEESRVWYDARSYGDLAQDPAATAVIRTDGHHEQPMPVPNDRGSIQALVRRDLVERERVGVARYGTPLQAFNGRDALRDAYEEAMDLTIYLRQMIAERDGQE